MTEGEQPFGATFLDDVASDIWQRARIIAQETETGTAMQSDKQIGRIRRELQSAAAALAAPEIAQQARKTKQLEDAIAKVARDIQAVKKAMAELKT